MSVTAPNSSDSCGWDARLGSESDNSNQYFSQAHWKRTYRHAYSVVGNVADAEDIAQEAYLRLFEAVINGRKIGSFLAWMKGVVRNVAVDRFRETRPDLHVALDSRVDHEDGDHGGVLTDLADHTTSTEDRLANESVLLESLRVLAELPGRDRECVMMYARGCTFVHIANVLNLPYEIAIKTTRKALMKTRHRIGR